jgi:hypothetical protein
MSIKDNVSAVVEVVKAVSADPNFKAAGQELGKAAHTAAKLVNNVLLPFAAVNYAFDKARVYYETRFQRDMAPKIEHLQPEQLVEPRASIAGPALQGLAFAHDEPDLKEMYLNLLAREMSSETQRANHPGFVEIVRQLTAEEARIFKAFVQKVEAMSLTSDAGWWKIERHEFVKLLERVGENVAHDRMVTMLENWVRLGLCRAEADLETVRDQIENFVQVEARRGFLSPMSLQRRDEPVYLILTQYGRQFALSVGIEEPKRDLSSAVGATVGGTVGSEYFTAKT